MIGEPPVVPPEEIEAHMVKVDQRWRDMDEVGMMARIAEVMPSAEARKAVIRRAFEAKSAEAKIHWFREEVSLVTNAIGHLSACRKGCSHCCHQGVTIAKVEAEAIGKAIGRRVAKPPKDRVMDSADMLEGPDRAESIAKFEKLKDWLQDTYIGVPCTFLKNDVCTIYAHRPLACRMHLNMDKDEFLCRLIDGHSIKVPYANFLTEQSLYSEMFIDSPIADLRDWFPS